MARVVFVVSRVVSVLCLVVLVVVAVFDAQAERYTAGRVPAEIGRRLDARPAGDYGRVVGIAHNAGDDLPSATRAVAYGADAIEIDVRSSGGELFASHDAPVPYLEDLFFRGPSLSAAWNIASLCDAVLLHLKERSPGYLARVSDFVRSQPPRGLYVQTDDARSLRRLRTSLPAARRLLLLLDRGDVRALQRDTRAVAAIDGVSVRDSLLSASLLAWLKARRLLTFVWVVNDEQRLNQLVAGGVDGVITERLDFMHVLGRGLESAR